MTNANPTLADLETAEAEFERQEARRTNYDGNNPSKYDTAVREAFERVQRR